MNFAGDLLRSAGQKLIGGAKSIISNPGAPTRKGEIAKMIPVIEGFFKDGIEYIKDPGTCEPGDIMMVGNHFYIGLSKRTNQEGAQ